MKITLKEKLVDYMIANGNSFTYTEMIKALLKIQRGEDYLYDWKKDRGYFATNFGTRGYMANGGGNCGVYKDTDGKWKAKYYTRDEMVAYKAKAIVSELSSNISQISAYYDREFQEVIRSSTYDSIRHHQLIRNLRTLFLEKYGNFQSEAIKKIVKIR